ncbi:hypothetical protein [Echinicola rosea]|uniref:Uncharacterized protein n=1 Tax=Echinicola rosea TaxID=1807691 RepID=A0ABQ1V1W8_9BACT|nr:hypothetical protein [Echinicola rosea]GGF34440.1 hypothetical protein GCM10011339_23370 [Echinicola rosea]
MTVAEQKAALTEKLKGAPQKFIDYNLRSIERMNFKDEDDFNGYADEVANDLQELQQLQANGKLKGFGGHPGRASNSQADDDSQKAKINEIVRNMLRIPPKPNATDSPKKLSKTKKMVKNIMKY